LPPDPVQTPTNNQHPKGQPDVGTLANGLMTCDWAAQARSYIPVFNVMPAHDWTLFSLGQTDSPDQRIMITVH